MSIGKKILGTVCAAVLSIQAAAAVTAASEKDYNTGGAAVVSVDGEVQDTSAALEKLGIDEDYAEKYLDENVDQDPTYTKLISEQGKVGLTNFSSLVSHQSRFNSFNKIYGIDVSVFNGNIDFNQVKKEGYSFVIVRAGARGYGSAGTLIDDSRFAEHVDNAHKAGLMVGVYFYTQAVNKTEVKQEADYTLKKIAGRKLELPVYFDIEPAYDVSGLPGRLVRAGLSKAQKAELCDYFCTYIKSKGYDAGMTSFYSWFYTDIDMSKLENKHDIWLAHYTSYTNYGGQFNMWQFASTRKVPGVASPNTDQDVRYVEVKKPTGNITLNYAIDGDYLYLAWNKISNAQGYSVYRKDGSGKVTKIGSTSQAVTALAMRDDTCQYYIQAYNTCGGQTYYSSNSNVVTISKPKISDGAKKVVLAGMNEFTTATAVSKQAFPNGSYSVVLASNTSFADALAAVPLADGLSAPILLTGPQSLQQDTMNEIKRLKAHSIFIMGGTLVVSQDMEDELKRQGYDVFRIGGATRFATAALVAENTDYVRKNNGKSQAKEIFFVSGENFADALSLGNIAARRNANILYMTKSAQFDDKTQQYLEKMKGKLTNIYIVGGPLAISENAEKVLAPYAPKITRIGGVNRFETSVKLNETFASDLTGDALCTTTGLNFPDALAGGVLAASLKAPVVIADNGYTSWLESYSKKRKPKTIYVFGGITKDII